MLRQDLAPFRREQDSRDPAPPRASCVSFSLSPNLSEPQLPCLSSGEGRSAPLLSLLHAGMTVGASHGVRRVVKTGLLYVYLGRSSTSRHLLLDGGGLLRSGVGEGGREGSSHEGRSAGICFDKLRHPEALWLRRVSVGAVGESGEEMGGRSQAGYLKTGREGGRQIQM